MVGSPGIPSQTTSSSAAFEQFCLLAKSQRGRALVALIEQVLNNDKIYLFGELLQMEAVQALRETEFASHLWRLEIFAYGTSSEYTAAKAADPSLPDLNANMTKKLRELSIVSLARRSKKVSYAKLQSELGINNVRELEDLIIDAMYAGLLDGRLDQANAVLKIRSFIARDVRPQEVAAMINHLGNLQAAVQKLMAAVRNNVSNVLVLRSEQESERKQVGESIAATKAQIAGDRSADHMNLDNLNGDNYSALPSSSRGFGHPGSRAKRDRKHRSAARTGCP